MQYPKLPQAQIIKSKKIGDEIMGTAKLFRVIKNVNDNGWIVAENNLALLRTEDLNEAIEYFNTL